MPVKEGAKQATSPAEVTRSCDITFSMLSDPEAAEAVAFGHVMMPSAEPDAERPPGKLTRWRDRAGGKLA